MTETAEWLSGARIGIVGLGYVGLPLAIEFGKHFPVIGFDVNRKRIEALRQGIDSTNEADAAELRAATGLTFSDQARDLEACNVYIVTVPTPIDRHKRPDLGPLMGASQTIGGVLKQGDTVIYESTVYPGCTEEDCVPVLERVSRLRFNVDFTAGYSPERINPGDREHRLTSIQKVTSGSTPEAARRIDALYASIIAAGTFPAASIRVAEAAKVIENTQRDLNIALINELAIIFNRMDIDTAAVLEAAATKWNFLPFRPGLVGGHCIGVDPYYLTHKAEALGYYPQVILAGRRINDGMGVHVASQLIKEMLKRRIHVDGARILVLGLTFKENCPDVRNTRVVDVIDELKSYGCAIDVHDPWVDAREALEEYGLTLIGDPAPGAYDGIVLAVAHEQFRAMGAKRIRALGRDKHVLYDLKHILTPGDSDLRL